MRKKHKYSKVFIILAVLVSLIIIFWGIKKFNNVTPEIELPPMVMIKNTLYQLESSTTHEPDSSSNGTIKKIIYNEVPSKNEQANFGKVNMEYWIIDNSIVIKLDNSFLKFTKSK